MNSSIKLHISKFTSVPVAAKILKKLKLNFFSDTHELIKFETPIKMHTLKILYQWMKFWIINK